VKKGRTGQNSSSGGSAWGYALLCLAIIGFLTWLFWSSSEEKLPVKQPVVPQAQLPPTHEPKVHEQVDIPRPTNASTIPLPPIPKFEPLITLPTNPPSSIQQPATNKLIVITNRPVSKTNHLAVETNKSATGPSNSPAPIEPQAKAPVRVAGRPVNNTLEVQIALARMGISSGSIDGALGSQTRSAIATFQKIRHLPPTGNLDTTTKSQLLITEPVFIQETITSNDLQRLTTIPSTWLGKSELKSMDYENILELLGEKSFSNPKLIRELNPKVNWNHVTPDTLVTIPSVSYPDPEYTASFIRISLQKRELEAFDSDTNLLAHFPCSIGKIAEKRPVGTLQIEVIIPNPNYTFNPEVFPESEEARSIGKKLVLPPGPNSPVGVVWIGLNRPGYGIHGTPGPEQVGRTESHGCFRLANWNASYLMQLSWVGMPVIIEP